MRKFPLGIAAGTFALSALFTAGPVIAPADSPIAPVSAEAALRWVGKDCYDSLGYRHTLWVQANDHGSYERIYAIKFHLRGEGVRSLYVHPDTTDTGVKLWDGNTGTTRWWNTGRWYHETPKYPGGVAVNEPATIGVNLTVEVSGATDRDYRCTMGI
jgi:hypothetical protein